MKAVAYSIKPFEKEYLARANRKKHDITLISNPLSPDTVIYAQGKDAVIVFTDDDVSAVVIEKLADLGIRFIVTRSAGTEHIDNAAAAAFGIKIANVPSYSPQATAEHAVGMAFALNRHTISANQQSHEFDFSNDGLVGFNFSGKTVGVIGLGRTGQAVAAIYNGLNCNVIGYDLYFPRHLLNVKSVSLEKLLQTSDIISLHIPLIPETNHFINEEKLSQMKDGVMLINTSRGKLIDNADVLAALETKKLGYLGLDVYEFEKDLFDEDRQYDPLKDTLLTKLMANPNVLITPHQAYLTREALQEIADQTIKSLDVWQATKCADKECLSTKDYNSIPQQNNITHP